MHKLLLPLILLLTATGGIAALTGAGEAADWLWGLATLPVSHQAPALRPSTSNATATPALTTGAHDATPTIERITDGRYLTRQGR